jgi:hypothetical protein
MLIVPPHDDIEEDSILYRWAVRNQAPLLWTGLVRRSAGHARCKIYRMPFWAAWIFRFCEVSPGPGIDTTTVRMVQICASNHDLADSVKALHFAGMEPDEIAKLILPGCSVRRQAF